VILTTRLPEVKNEWSYTSTPPIGLNGMGKDWQKDNIKTQHQKTACVKAVRQLDVQRKGLFSCC
jgi:hypothetical protein